MTRVERGLRVQWGLGLIKGKRLRYQSAMNPNVTRPSGRAELTAITRCLLLSSLLCASNAIAGDPCGDPALGSCFEVRPQPGCSDAACCTAVCRIDPFCCDVEWDYICRQGANDSPACNTRVPSNDTSANATFIGIGLIPFTTVGATDSDVVEIPAECGGIFGDEIRRDVWFEYRAAVTGSARFSLCPTTGSGAWADFDPIIVARDALSMEIIGCNDEGPGCAGYPVLDLGVAAGSRYLIQVGGHDAFIGGGAIRVTETGSPAPTAQHDTCADAASIASGTTVEFDLLGAARDNAMCSDALDDVWFRVLAAKDAGVLTVRVCGADAPSRVEVVVGDCDAKHMCSDIIDCASFAPFEIEVAAGIEVLLRVASSARAAGTLETTFEGVPACPSDRNSDGLVNAADLSLVLAYWGTPEQDIDGDGLTNAADLSLVLAYWGGCS